jgi:LPXTG-motif cell wall-anchored protein
VKFDICGFILWELISGLARGLRHTTTALNFVACGLSFRFGGRWLKRPRHFRRIFMKNTRWTLLAALVMAAPAFAQSPGSAGMPPEAMQAMRNANGAPGGTAVNGDSGTISNATVTDTTTMTSTTEGISPDGIAVAVEPGMQTTELPSTGGAPITMSLLGLSMAMGAFALRRRVQGSSRF